MALFVWEKYHSSYVPGRYASRFTGSTSYTRSASVGGCGGFSLSQIDGTYSCINGGSSIPMGSSGTVYGVYTTSYTQYSVSGSSVTASNYESYWRNGYYTIGSFIEELIGEKDAYPEGHSGGYYYKRVRVASTPVITQPSSGDVVSGEYTVKWTASDTGLRFRVEISTDNGQTWSTVGVTTVDDAVGYTLNATSYPQTSLALLRVYALADGYESRPGETDGVFTIQHNVAPNAPSTISPKGSVVDRTIPQEIVWRHNDPNPNDLQSSAVLSWRLQGDTLWTKVGIMGSTQRYVFAANTLPAGKIEWMVQTFDQQGLESPQSSVAVFTAAEPTNMPTIIKPDDVVSVARPVIQWASGAQQMYQIVVEDSLGTIVWDTGNVISTAKARTVGTDLINGARYKIKVRIMDGGGLYSSYAIKDVIVSYTPPAKPNIQALHADSGVQLVIDNPTPTGTQPLVTHMSLFKRVEEEYILLEERINQAYIDYTTPSDTEVKYIVRVFGDNGTFTNSEVVTTKSPKLRGVWLHDVDDPDLTVKQFLYVVRESKSDSYLREHTYRQYAGRKRPVVEYGSYMDYGLKLTIQLVKDELGRERLIQFLNTGAVLLYRDGDGRKFYTTLPQVNMDQMIYGHQIDLELTEIDYHEGV